MPLTETEISSFINIYKNAGRVMSEKTFKAPRIDLGNGEILTRPQFLSIIQPILEIGNSKHLNQLTLQQQENVVAGIEFLWKVSRELMVDTYSGYNITFHADTDYLLPTMELPAETQNRIKTKPDSNSLTLEFDELGSLIIGEYYTRRRIEIDSPPEKFIGSAWKDSTTEKTIKVKRNEKKKTAEGEVRVGSYVITDIGKTILGKHLHLNVPNPTKNSIDSERYEGASGTSNEIEPLKVGDIARAVAIIWGGATDDRLPYDPAVAYDILHEVLQKKYISSDFPEKDDKSMVKKTFRI